MAATLRQLVEMGNLRADSDPFGARLKMTETARGVLKGETEIRARRRRHTRKRAIRSKRGAVKLQLAGGRRGRRIRRARGAQGVASEIARQRGVAGLCRAARFTSWHSRLTPGDDGGTARHRRDRPTRSWKHFFFLREELLDGWSEAGGLIELYP